MNIRIGQGFDVHRLEAGLPFKVGGIEIGTDLGPVAHSDGDVLLHAVCDALLGACGLRDIGYHFPNTDENLSGIDSCILLERTYELVQQQGFKLVNLDASVCLEYPKVNPHVEAMKEKLAGILGTTPDRIAIKATTNEKLGYVGRKEGVFAMAVVLLSGE